MESLVRGLGNMNKRRKDEIIFNASVYSLCIVIYREILSTFSPLCTLLTHAGAKNAQYVNRQTLGRSFKTVSHVSLFYLHLVLMY